MTCEQSKAFLPGFRLLLYVLTPEDSLTPLPAGPGTEKFSEARELVQ